ncbi:MAG: hypothetical protein ACYDGR_14110 [Candidatus Dormibacteria bacterium]
MAIDPASHPLDEEIEGILAADPELLTRLDKVHQEYDRGDLALVDHAEVTRRLRALGVPIDESPSPGPTPNANR